MSPAHSRKSPKLPILKTLMALLLVIMLVACGTNAATPTSPAQSRADSTVKKPASTPTFPQTSNIPSTLNAANINAKIGNLLIQSSDGFQCPYSSSNKSDLELGQLVFASDRTTYSQAEIAQMSAYLTYIESHNGNEGVLNGGTEPPPTLRWILGGETAPIPGTATGFVAARDQGCEAFVTLTNTGNTPIQVSKVGVQLKEPPQQNTYQYRLIDACSLKVPYCPPTGEGGGGDCSVYFVSIQLGLGKQNDVFSAAPTGLSGCSVPTLAPGVQIYLDLEFSLAANIPQNLVYSVLPVFTVDTTQGEQTLALPQLGSTFAFAGTNQFSCYGLQGTSFAPVKSPVFAEGSGAGKTQSWCV